MLLLVKAGKKKRQGFTFEAESLGSRGRGPSPFVRCAIYFPLSFLTTSRLYWLELSFPHAALVGQSSSLPCEETAGTKTGIQWAFVSSWHIGIVLDGPTGVLGKGFQDH